MNHKKTIFFVASIAVVSVIIGLTILANSNKASDQIEQHLIENIDTSISAPVLSDEDENMMKNFEILSAAVEAGHSTDSITEEYPTEYQYFILKGPNAFKFLKNQIKSEEITIRKKIATEWLISDIIKEQAGEEVGSIRVEYWKAITNKSCSGKIAPSLEAEHWSEIPENTVLQITGMFSEWYTARFVCAYQEGTSDRKNFETDGVEFWINQEDLYGITNNPAMTFGSVHQGTAEEYVFIIKENIEEEYNYGLDQMVAQAKVYESPSETGNVLGYTFSNDLIRLIKDCYNQPIRVGEWILVEKIPKYWDPSDTGWIKETYLTSLEEDMTPSQGYILRHTNGYSEADEDTLSEVINENAIACVHISERKNGYLKINAGLNSFAIWVKEEDVYYKITAEISEKINNPVPDWNLFIEQLQKDIITNPDFRLKAEDTGTVGVLSEKQKTELANSLQQVSDPIMVEGSVMDIREAAYPFYRLDFTDYSIVITTKDQLMLILGKKIGYNYGVGREGAPIRFVTPNIEFINEIRQLLPIQLNQDRDDFIYLLNADHLNIESEWMEDTSTKVQEQINKVVRTIKSHTGKELSKDILEQDVTEKNVFQFGWKDGSFMTVTFTDKYVEYNGKYYEPLMSPEELMSSLFSAYF